jgi:small ligand-binding sensory domain FIST
VEHWIGTVGMGICVDARECYDQPAVGDLVGTFPEDSFRVFPTLDSDLSGFINDHGTWYEAGERHFVVAHGDPRSAYTPAHIPQLAQTVPQSYLVGGLSSSQYNDFPQYADGACEGGISGVLFSDHVPVATSLSQGCSLIGEQHRITQCSQNVITTIDDRPALDVFNEEIGEVLARDLSRVAGYIFVALPIRGSDTGDYVVRNLVGIDPENKQLIIGDLVEPGQRIQLCRRDGSSAWEDLDRTLTSLTRRAGGTVKGALYYSCLGRGRHLFGENSEELKAIQSHLGNVPLAGFFANGEIARDQLYGYTGVLTLFL